MASIALVGVKYTMVPAMMLQSQCYDDVCWPLDVTDKSLKKNKTLIYQIYEWNESLNIWLGIQAKIWKLHYSHCSLSPNTV